jgi:hypothetical protein
MLSSSSGKALAVMKRIYFFNSRFYRAVTSALARPAASGKSPRKTGE